MNKFKVGNQKKDFRHYNTKDLKHPFYGGFAAQKKKKNKKGLLLRQSQISLRKA